MTDPRDTPVTTNYHLDPRDDEYPFPCEICHVRQARIFWLSPDVDMELSCLTCWTCYGRLCAVDIANA